MKPDLAKYNSPILTHEQLKALRKQWFIFGNNGKKHSHLNHKYIQGFIECNHDRKGAYLKANKRCLAKDRLTQECIDIVEAIVYEM